ncbi:unnamed protein product [Leuciscus chuanchicus]
MRDHPDEWVQEVDNQSVTASLGKERYRDSSLTKPIHHQTMSWAESVWIGGIAAPENDLMEKTSPLAITAGASGNRSHRCSGGHYQFNCGYSNKRITNLNYNLRIVDFTQADRRNTDIHQGWQRG